MDESISIKHDETTLTFNLFWYKAHHDVQISEHDADGKLMHRMLFVPSIEELREIANQFYEWADTLENHYDDLEHQAMINRDDELLYFLKKRGEHGAADVWEQLSKGE